MFQHAAHHAFSSGNVASETNHKFAGPVAHNISSLRDEVTTGLILMSFAELSNLLQQSRFKG
jgi:hypothetical protein